MKLQRVFTDLAALMLLSALSVPVLAKGRAVGETYNMNIRITGTVTASGHCDFVDHAPPTIDFGDVSYSTAGNALVGTYTEDLLSKMACTGDTEGGATMTFSSPDGSTSDYQGHKTLPVAMTGSSDKTGLGVALLVDGQMQDINTAFSVDIKSPPALTVQLVQTDIGGTLTNGAKINTSATLTMAFD